MPDDARRVALPSRSNVLALVVVLLVLLLTNSTQLGATLSSTHAAPSTAAHLANLSPASTTAAPVGPTARPFTTTFSPFYNSSAVDSADFPGICSGFCAQQAQSPSVMTLTNGHLGVAFSVVTNQTPSTCSNAAGNSTIQIGFALSSDSGKSFAAPKLIGDGGSSACPNNQFLEPSFASASTGHVFGAYVEANATRAQMFQQYGEVIYPFAVRSNDSIAFVSSTANGTTFSNGKVLVTGANLSRPALAAFGSSVYIVYQNESQNNSNGTLTIPGGHNPVVLDFLYSTDAGATWHGPSQIPTEPRGDPAELNTTLSPSIAVNATGTVAVGFADNRSCLAWCTGAYGQAYGYDIVVVTSTTNGTSWKGPYLVAQGAGEAPGNSAYGLFQENPTTSIAFGPTPGSLYLASSASVNLSLNDTQFAFTVPGADYSRPTILASASTTNGVTWSTSVALAAPLRAADGFQQLFGEANFNPGLAVSPSGTVYAEWTYFTWTNGACGFTAFTANSYAQSTEQYVATSPDGISWSTPSLVNVSTPSAGIDYLNYLGYQGSIAFTAGGQPVLAYAMPLTFLQYNFTTGNNWDISAVLVSVPYLGPTTTLTFMENGLTAGTAWTAIVQGVGVNTTASSFTVTDVPKGRPVYIQWPYGFPRPGSFTPFVAPVVSDAPLVQTSPAAIFNGPSTIYFNFTTFYPLGIQVVPRANPSLSLFWQNYGPNASFQYNRYDYTYFFGATVYSGSSGCPGPWFFPKGMTLDIGSSVGNMNLGLSGSTPIGYWTGTGPGNYTGTGPNANLTMNGPVNETAWMSGAGTYSELFRAPELPTTSTFTIHVDGAPYSGLGQTNLSVPDLGTGPHLLSNLTANSSRSGWEYFGRADTGGRFILPEQPVVNLSFALVNVTAAPGIVAFHAPQLSAGTVWRLEVNGTAYSSNTPWINVTTRPGNFSILASPIVSATADSTLAPVTASSSESVTPGHTYDVNYTAAYRVQVSASAGGTASIRGVAQTFYQPGASVSFNAAPSPGYTWGGWTGSGAGSYSGPNASATITVQGPTVEVASFVPLALDRFNLTVQETGVPNGTEWSVNLNGVGYSSNSSTLVIGNLYSYASSGNLGRYTLQVPYAYANGTTPGTRYVPTVYSTTALGGGTALVQFVPQYYLQVQSTTGALAVTLPGWQAAGQVVTLSALANPGYVFDRWVGSGPGSYSGTVPDSAITVNGPITETAIFLPEVAPPAPRYSVTFQLTSALDSGTAWTVRFNGTNLTSVGSQLTVPGLLPGSYTATVYPALAPSGLTEYLPASPTVQVQVTANRTVSVTYDAQYFVSVRATGPGTATPASGWRAAGTTVEFSATPSGSNLFLGWSGTGAGSFSGTELQWNLKVTGPVTEIASFGTPAPVAAKTTSSSTSLWNNPLLWVALAAVGLAAGLGLGWALVRRRGGPPPASPVPASAAEEPASDDPAPQDGGA
ncbi:MAG: glycoside hydrolase [Thermoplasmata archaeon]|nr:glycoside hydrolase [Thermoplasmata archaeon]